MEDKILLPYAPILVESTRSIGYSFETALADVIDNCIGKDATNIEVLFSATAPFHIAIVDNGSGMTSDGLEEAMRYGSQNPLNERDPSDLGRFGLGLKTATLSQCRKLTVITKQSGVLNAACWDLDYIIEKENWILQRYNADEISKFLYVDMLKPLDSGTIVIWEEFDRLLSGTTNQQNVFNEKLELASQHLALVFHRFIGNENLQKRVKISFNGAALEAVDPFLTTHPATQPLVEQTIRIENQTIKVKPYILPHNSKLNAKDRKKLGDLNDLRQNQGFYVYRNRRLIIWGTWFRLVKQHELNKLARIQVDIPNSLDAVWDIDIKKSSAALPDIIKKNLLHIVESAIGKSERVYSYRGRKTNDDNLQRIWNIVDNRGVIQYLINRDSPLFKQLESTLDDAGQQRLDSLIKTIEDAFPFADVYFRSAKSEAPIQSKALAFEEVYQIALDAITNLQSLGVNPNSFIKNMHLCDPFTHYPEVVERIREDFKNDE